MLDVRVTALSTSEFAFFPSPPNRPSRSERRREGRAGAGTRLIRAIRRELAGTTVDPGMAWLPPVTNYPYGKEAGR